MAISTENHKFFAPRVFCAPLKGFLGNWVSVLGVSKLESWATGPRKKFDDIFSSLDTIHQRDGRTDGHTLSPGASKDCAFT